MTQPKNLLLNIMGSKSLSKGWGNLMTATILMALIETTFFIRVLEDMNSETSLEFAYNFYYKN
jgi:hypothetical protein